VTVASGRSALGSLKAAPSVLQALTAALTSTIPHLNAPRSIPCLALLGALQACGPTITPSFDSPEPGARNAAIVKAAGKSETASLPDLVRMLESDDPATRMLAIATLKLKTGESNGYETADPEFKRNQAVSRWREYVEQKGNATRAGGGTPAR